MFAFTDILTPRSARTTATTSLLRLDLRVQEHLGGDLSVPARTSASSAAHVFIFRGPSPALATSSCLRPSSPRLSKMYPLVRGPPASSIALCARLWYPPAVLGHFPVPTPARRPPSPPALNFILHTAHGGVLSQAKYGERKQGGSLLLSIVMRRLMSISMLWKKPWHREYGSTYDCVLRVQKTRRYALCQHFELELGQNLWH
ncbi:hypothetical protein FIBSPDRAFT_929402 [Athelia psychrophila]|uniref:Uncharacterized protein n=1 Tax=Athelia psychrophila TaxID=1759441 RepID=A0A166NKH3_9AGAM|nr:hypothetical protein FIBSPDRAFT_929402 [Fibularhizoctonia sp. CBS 109695]